jgi:hypothetical protein
VHHSRIPCAGVVVLLQPVITLTYGALGAQRLVCRPVVPWWAGLAHNCLLLCAIPGYQHRPGLAGDACRGAILCGVVIAPRALLAGGQGCGAHNRAECACDRATRVIMLAGQAGSGLLSHTSAGKLFHQQGTTHMKVAATVLPNGRSSDASSSDATRGMEDKSRQC